MKLSTLNSFTNGIRHSVNIKKNLLSKTNNLNKKHIFGFKRFVGRSSITGRITVRHKGGGCKKKYRKIEFFNFFKNSIVISTFYDPFRSSFISFSFDFQTKNFFHSLATCGVSSGFLEICRNTPIIDLKLGDRLSLKNVPPGSVLHSLSLDNISKAKFVRSAGLYFLIIQKSITSCKIRLPSGLIKKISVNSFGTLGHVSNFKHNQCCIGKAGKNRLKGIRPSVRGIAMNPVDHPHGGKANGGMVFVTPWGIPTQGKRTVLSKNKV